MCDLSSLVAKLSAQGPGFTGDGITRFYMRKYSVQQDRKESPPRDPRGTQISLQATRDHESTMLNYELPQILLDMTLCQKSFIAAIHLTFFC